MVYLQRKYAGYLAVIISGIIFGCMPLLAKIVFNNGGNPINLVFWRFFISIFPLYIILKRNKNVSLMISKMEIKQVIILGVFGLSATTVTLFLSYNYISTGMATTLHFVYPIFVIIGYSVFYKEKISPIKLISVVLCTLGIFLLYDGNSSASIIGIIYALLSGVIYAFYVLYIDKSGLKTMNPIKLTMYLSIVGSFAMLIFSLASGSFTMKLNLTGWLFTIILSIVVSLGGVSLLSVGIKLIGPQSSSILSTLEPITSVVIGAAIFEEVLGLRGIIACSLILMAVILIAVFDIKEEKIKEKEKEKYRSDSLSH